MGKDSDYVCKAEAIKIRKLNMLIYIGQIGASENNSKFYSLFEIWKGKFSCYYNNLDNWAYVSTLLQWLCLTMLEILNKDNVI